MINLYKQRRCVKEVFRTLKERLDVIHFSGITLQPVQQDFYANVLIDQPGIHAAYKTRAYLPCLFKC